MAAMKRGAAIAVLLFASLARAEPRAVFVAQPGRIVAALLPVSLLDEREVKKQLGSGLTTTFLLVAQQREGDQRGATRIEVRYDLWDEVWLVRRIETDGRDDRQRLASREALEKWWRAPVRLFAANEDRVMLKVTLTVLPFSVAEGEDARQWIAKSGSLGAPGATSPLVTALIGTTISAKPIRSYHWSADISFK